jgi:arginine:ornithine antiporter/lysine permease
MALPALTAVAAGLMIGSGIFMLPRWFGDATGVFDALIAWAVAGDGKFTPARVFQSSPGESPTSTPASTRSLRAGI